MSIRSHAAFALLVLASLHAVPASAQIGNKLAIGATFSTQHAADTSSVADGEAAFQFEWRIGHARKSSWGWQLSLFNWFSSDVSRNVAGTSTDLGELHVKPLMAGYGYTWFVNPRVAVTGDLLAGYAFSSFSIASAAENAYRTRLGASALDADTSNPLVVSPEVHVWYDVNDKFGLLISGGYLFARPDVVIHSSIGDDVHRLRADTYTLRAGLVFRIF